jgi:hypothetical protein
MGGLGITREEADPVPIGLPRGVWGGGRVSEAVEGFVTSLAVATWLGLDTATCLTRAAEAELIMEETSGWHTFYSRWS